MKKKDRGDKNIRTYPAKNYAGKVLTIPAGKKKSEKLIFLPIHKNASTNLTRTIGGQQKHYSVKEFKNLKCPKIVILRDPWARFISAIRQVYKNKFNKETIERMLSYLESHPQEEINTHLALQSWFLKDREFDYYIKLENIKEDWKILEKEFGLKPFPRSQTSKPKEKIKDLFKEKDLKNRALKYLEKDYELISKVFNRNL